MWAELLDSNTGRVIATGQVTLSRDGHTGVIELEGPLPVPFVEDRRPALLRMASTDQLQIAIAETLPSLKRVPRAGFPSTVWFFLRRDQ